MDNHFNGKIYKIEFPNGKVYIGQTFRSLEQRQKEHKKDANSGNTRLLYNALRKYDMVDTFELIEIDNADTEEELCEKEIMYIGMYESFDEKYGYNMTYGGEGSNGYKFTDEDKIKMSKAQKKRFEDPEYRKQNAERQAEINQSLHSRRKGDETPFVVYTKNGEFIGEFNYTCDAIEKLLKLGLIRDKDKKNAPNYILRVLQQENWVYTTTTKRYFWHDLFFKYISEIGYDWTFEKQLCNINKQKRERYVKPFIVYNVDTQKYIGKFELVKELCTELKLDFVRYQGEFSAVLHKRRSTAYGYFLIYTDEINATWSYEEYLNQLHIQSTARAIEKVRKTIPTKLKKYEKVQALNKDTEYYIRPYMCKGIQTGWYVYIDNIATTFCIKDNLIASKEIATEFVNIMKMCISVK